MNFVCAWQLSLMKYHNSDYQYTLIFAAILLANFGAVCVNLHLILNFGVKSLFTALDTARANAAASPQPIHMWFPTQDAKPHRLCTALSVPFLNVTFRAKAGAKRVIIHLTARLGVKP